MLRHYNVTFYCSTIAESASEAVQIAVAQVRMDHAAYIEVEELDAVDPALCEPAGEKD